MSSENPQVVTITGEIKTSEAEVRPEGDTGWGWPAEAGNQN